MIIRKGNQSERRKGYVMEEGIIGLNILQYMAIAVITAMRSRYPLDPEVRPSNANLHEFRKTPSS